MIKIDKNYLGLYEKYDAAKAKSYEWQECYLYFADLNIVLDEDNRVIIDLDKPLVVYGNLNIRFGTNSDKEAILKTNTDIFVKGNFVTVASIYTNANIEVDGLLVCGGHIKSEKKEVDLSNSIKQITAKDVLVLGKIDILGEVEASRNIKAHGPIISKSNIF